MNWQPGDPPLEQHPLSKLFPPMPPDEYRELVEDVRRQGVLEPIVLLDGKVLDGWHRYQAGRDAGVEVPTREWDNPDGQETAFTYVWAKNALRRHLTSGQVVAIKAGAHPEDWQQIQSGRGVYFRDADRDADGKAKRRSGGESTKAAHRLAEAANVDVSYVYKAKRIERGAPDLWSQVAAGEKSIDAADREHRERIKAKEQADRERFHAVAERVRAKEADKKEAEERRSMEWRGRFVAEVLEKAKAITTEATALRKEVELGLKHEKFAPEAKAFLSRRIDRPIETLIEIQEILK